MSRTVYVLGDSLSTNAYVLEPWQEIVEWPMGWSVVSACVPSRTLMACANNNGAGGAGNNVYDHLADAGGLFATYNATTPRTIIIFAGTNDVYFGVDGPMTAARLQGVIAAIRTACPVDRIAVIAPIPRGNTNFATSPAIGGAITTATMQTALTAYRAAIRGCGQDVTIDPTTEGRFGNPDTNPGYVDTCHIGLELQKYLAAVARQTPGVV